MISLLIFFLVINNNGLSFTNKNRHYYQIEKTVFHIKAKKKTAICSDKINLRFRR